MRAVLKTTFEEEKRLKDEAFLNLTPLQRVEQACRLREFMRKEGVNYSYEGQKVKVTRIK